MSPTDEALRKAVALFRYGLIADVLPLPRHPPRPAREGPTHLHHPRHPPHPCRRRDDARLAQPVSQRRVRGAVSEDRHRPRSAPLWPFVIDTLASAAPSRFSAAHADMVESVDVDPFVALPEGEGGVAHDALIIERTATRSRLGSRERSDLLWYDPHHGTNVRVAYPVQGRWQASVRRPMERDRTRHHGRPSPRRPRTTDSTWIDP